MMASSPPRPLATSAGHQVGAAASRLRAALLHLVVGQQALVVPQAARIVVDHDVRATAPLFWISSSLSTCSWFSAIAKRAPACSTT